MSDSTKTYAELSGTPEWGVIDRAVRELVAKRELVETTEHEAIVGYLCKSLAERQKYPPELMTTLEERIAALNRIRDIVQRANPTNRDLAEELIAERRAEAAREESGLGWFYLPCPTETGTLNRPSCAFAASHDEHSESLGSTVQADRLAVG